MKMILRIILVILLVGFLAGSTYVMYNFVISDSAATTKELKTMQQNFDERLQKAKAERSVIKKNQSVLRRKIDSLAWRQKLIMSKQSTTHFKLDSLQRDMDAVHDKLNTLKLGQRIIHKEVRGQKSKTFLEKLVQ